MLFEDKKVPVKNPDREREFESAAGKIFGETGKLAQELWKAYRDLSHISYAYIWGKRGEAFSDLHNAYAKLCGIHAKSADMPEDFWNRKFTKAIKKLFGKDEAETLRDICSIIMDGPYAHSAYRPSYRSRRAGDYADNFFTAVLYAVNYNCYELSLQDAMNGNHTDIQGFEDRLALSLRRGDREIGTLTREAILGESGKIKLSNQIIRGIIKSSEPEYLDLLGKLLLAAKGQEGIRQAILENADCGTPRTHAYFIKLIIDNNLARFSSVIRAFGTWTGLGYDDIKPAVIDKCVRLAYNHLSGESKYEEGLKSADVLEIYTSLWARACFDIGAAQEGAKKLVEAPEKYRRLTGWYFIYGSVHKKLSHEIAVKHIGVREPEELAWICCCLYGDSVAVATWRWENEKRQAFFPDDAFPESRAERRAQFDELCAVLDFIGNKKTKFEGSIFPWAWVQLESDDAAKCALGLAGVDMDPYMITKLSKYLPQTEVDFRRAYYINLLDPSNAGQRDTLLAGLSDKSLAVKSDVLKRLAKENLRPSDIDFLVGALTTQSAELRKSVMSLLDKQDESLVLPAIKMLIGSDNDKQLLAGAELIGVFGEKNPALLTKYADTVSHLLARADLPKDIAIILNGFTEKAPEDTFNAENGYGLYNPSSPDFNKNTWATKRPRAKVYAKKELARLLKVDDDELCGAIMPIQNVILSNEKMECETETYGGGRSKVIIGAEPYRLPLKPAEERRPGARGIYNYYLADEIVAALNAAKVSPTTIAKILCYTSSGLHYGSRFTPETEKIFDGLPFSEELDFNKYVKLKEMLVQSTLRSVLEANYEGVFDFALAVWKNLVELIPETDIMKAFQTKSQSVYYYSYSNYEANCMLKIGIISSWRDIARQSVETDEQFAAFWNEAWYEYLLTGRRYMPVYDNLSLFRAHKAGLISDDALLFELVSGSNAAGYMHCFTGDTKWTLSSKRTATLQKQANETYPLFKPFLAKAIDRIVTVEERRGELPTPLTSAAANIGYFFGGVKHFAALLTALGKDGFHRGYSWAGSDHTKKTTLSVLLKNCYPLPEDTADGLNAALKSAGITKNRLLQAVMYAPQWTDLAEKATCISGLSSAVWLFHAHINERFSVEKETKVALYSPISQQQFADGTFDKDWFLEAYAAVGEKTFDELYKNAKYITESNGAHRRSQLYTDAVLGRLDKSQTETEITDKRNQEKLRAYALIPLDGGNPGDALARYEFIQKYAKEIKQFGAQRQASEKKAVLIALQNLALTTGFGDSDRMTWYLESQKMDGLRPLTKPQDIGGVTVCLEFDGDGTPAICVSKEGKPLKAVPKALADNQTVIEIQTAVKDLKDQKKRAKLGFEMAMVSRTAFTAGEVSRLMRHPALSGMIASLAFVSGEFIGFPKIRENRLYLVSLDGKETEPHYTASLIIAHPYDFITGKCWSAYQRRLYENKIVQPFKQIFREYYPVTQDELSEINISRRYAGNQVQPQKTVALLKTRGWTADYEEGLQRVYHKENLIAKMYALADWFSPSDIEAPTIEEIRFFSRDEDRPLPFKEIPPVIFSEVMRDIDLVVSAAHAGGVDPESSSSTVEMRIAIAKELLAMLSVSNVKFQTAHAEIEGAMGNYSVHMGSGVTHQNGVGMLAVLPVHSQARGRIFLPFADEDPKTAEIMSKILLFADDNKIKDPAILSQISG